MRRVSLASFLWTGQGVWQEVLLLHLEVMRLCYGTGRVHLFRLGRHNRMEGSLPTGKKRIWASHEIYWMKGANQASISERTGPEGLLTLSLLGTKSQNIPNWKGHIDHPTHGSLQDHNQNSNPLSESVVQALPEFWKAWGGDCCPEEPVLCPPPPAEKAFPNNQSDPPLMQLHAKYKQGLRWCLPGLWRSCCCSRSTGAVGLSSFLLAGNMNVFSSPFSSRS